MHGIANALRRKITGNTIPYKDLADHQLFTHSAEYQLGFAAGLTAGKKLKDDQVKALLKKCEDGEL